MIIILTITKKKYKRRKLLKKKITKITRLNKKKSKNANKIKIKGKQTHIKSCYLDIIYY